MAAAKAAIMARRRSAGAHASVAPDSATEITKGSARGVVKPASASAVPAAAPSGTDGEAARQRAGEQAEADEREADGERVHAPVGGRVADLGRHEQHRGGQPLPRG